MTRDSVATINSQRPRVWHWRWPSLVFLLRFFVPSRLKGSMEYSDGGEGRSTQHARATSSSSRIRTKKGLAPGDHDHRGTLKLGKLLQSVLHSPLLLQHDSGYQPTPLPTVDNRRNALVLDPSEVEIPPPSPAQSDDSSVYSLLSPPSPTAYQALITTSSPEKTAKRLPFFPSSPNRRRERSEDYLSSPQDTSTKSTAKALFPRLKSALIPSGKQTRRMLRKKHRPEIPYEVTDEPLDGEEGELIEDEGCYIDVCVKSCIGALPSFISTTSDHLIDILSMLPDELSISILLFVDFSDIVACLGVSHHWRRLASDGLIWRSFFYRAGFGINSAVARKQATTPSTPLPEQQTVQPPLSIASLSYTQHLSYVLSHRGSLTSLGTCQSLDSPSAPSRRHSVTSIAPLSFDWMAMYRTRQEIERRWAGMEPHRTSMRGHMDAVYCVEWDGTKIVTGSRDRTIKVWSVKTGKCLGTLYGHEGSVLCLKFDATGFLASGSSDQRVMIWNIGVNKSRQFEWQHVGQLWGHTGGVLDLKIDEKWIVSW